MRGVPLSGRARAVGVLLRLLKLGLLPGDPQLAAFSITVRRAPRRGVTFPQQGQQVVPSGDSGVCTADEGGLS